MLVSVVVSVVSLAVHPHKISYGLDYSRSSLFLVMQADEIACPQCSEWIPVQQQAAMSKAATLTCPNCGWTGVAQMPQPLDDDDDLAISQSDTNRNDQHQEHLDYIQAMQQELLKLAAATSRGEWANDGEKSQARFLVESIEAAGLVSQPAASRDCQGTWELVFSDTQLFRSSPFFMVGRAVCSTQDEARRYDAFCELHRAALAISSIRKVRQIIRLDRPSMITSEFEVRSGAVPFISDIFRGASYSGGVPVAIDGAIVTSASIENVDAAEWELLLDRVEIKGSNIPILRQVCTNSPPPLFVCNAIVWSLFTLHGNEETHWALNLP